MPTTLGDVLRSFDAFVHDRILAVSRSLQKHFHVNRDFLVAACQFPLVVMTFYFPITEGYGLLNIQAHPARYLLVGLEMALLPLFLHVHIGTIRSWLRDGKEFEQDPIAYFERHQRYLPLGPPREARVMFLNPATFLIVLCTVHQLAGVLATQSMFSEVLDWCLVATATLMQTVGFHLMDSDHLDPKERHTLADATSAELL